MHMHTSILVLLLVECVLHCYSYTYDEIKTLKKKLFEGYDSDLRPVLNQTDIVRINISLSIDSIEYLDAKSQTLKWSGFLDMMWYDELLSWNSSVYSGIDSFVLPQRMIWKPDVVILNDVQSSNTLGTEDTLTYISSSGHVIWEPSIVTKTTCKIDIRKYPFDTQKCKITIVSWMTTNISINITPSRPDVHLDQFTPHGEFIMSKTYTQVISMPSEYAPDQFLPTVNFVLVMRRRLTFYWLSMLFPMMSFPLICPISFMLTADSGEKITLSITVVLSYMVFIASMSDSMPKLSNELPLLLLYADIQIAICMLSVVASGLIICINKHPPQTQNYDVDKQPNSDKPDIATTTKINPPSTNFTKEVSNNGQRFNPPTGSSDREKWISVSRNLDKICFVMFTLFSTATTVVFGYLLEVSTIGHG